MRKVTKESVDALMNGRNYKSANTVVRNNALYLHDNKIAWMDVNGQLWIANCGYCTMTTKERLNGLPNVRIYQKNRNWFLNDEYWDGSAICIGKVN